MRKILIIGDHLFNKLKTVDKQISIVTGMSH